MATTYPTSQQTFTDPLASNPLNSPSHSTLHTNMNDTVEALQAQLGYTGAFLFALLAGQSGGQTLTGGTASGDDLTLKSTSHSTKGSLIFDDLVELWPSLPDNPATNSIISFSPSWVDSSGTGTNFNVLNIAPTFSNSGSLLLFQLSAVKAAGTYSFGTNPTYTNLFQLFVAQPSLRATAANVVISAWTMLSQQDMRASASITAGSTSNYIGFSENSLVGHLGTSGSIGFSTFTGLSFAPRMDTASGATTTITDLRALVVSDVSKAGTGTNTVTNQVAIDIANLTGGATLNLSLRSAGSAVQMRHAGPASFGGNSAPDTTLHLKGSTAAITFEESSAAPANPSDGAQVRMYMKSNAIIFQYQDGATTRYKSLTLSGTGVTWSHATTSP